MNDERDYFQRCEHRERRMANVARCDRARRVHERLADIYAERRAGLQPYEAAGALIIINDMRRRYITPLVDMDDR